MRFAAGTIPSGIRLPSSAPERLLVAPTDLKSADPLEADDLLEGRFSFAGKVVDTGSRPPFSVEMPSDGFASALASFEWLRHLRTRSDPQTGVFARAAVLSFLRRHKRISGLAWDDRTTIARLSAFLSHSPVILKGADSRFYRRFITLLARHERLLRNRYPAMPKNEVQLKAAIVIAMASLCLDVPERQKRQAAKRLDAALERQILSDGGHIARNPQTLLDILIALLPLRQTFINLETPLPKRLVPAIDRIYPALRFFRHSDGNLALFNGAGALMATELAAVLRYDETGGTGFKALPHTGFQRLEAGGTVILVDSGKALNTELSKTGHAGATAFEMSSGQNRFVINSGQPQAPTEDLFRMARSTSAHSTVSLDDHSSVQFLRSHYVGFAAIDGISRVDVTRETDAQSGDSLTVGHDGYLHRHGLNCHRTIALSADGRRITGCDSFTQKRNLAPDRGDETIAVIRFHLHPKIWAIKENPSSIFMTAPDNESWLFAAPDFDVELEDDAFFASTAGITRSRQITVRFKVGGHPECHWLFEKQS